MKRALRTFVASLALAVGAASCAPAQPAGPAAPLVWLADRATRTILRGDCTLRAPWTERALLMTSRHPDGIRTKFTYGAVGCSNPISFELSPKDAPAQLLDVRLKWEPDCEAHAWVDSALQPDGEVFALLVPTERRCDAAF